MCLNNKIVHTLSSWLKKKLYIWFNVKHDVKKLIIYYVLGHIWPQIWYLAIIHFEKLVLKMHYKLIQEGHMCNLVLEKDLNLVANGSFYWDCTQRV
jgi:hypothetical protein